MVLKSFIQFLLCVLQFLGISNSSSLQYILQKTIIYYLYTQVLSFFTKSWACLPWSSLLSSKIECNYLERFFGCVEFLEQFIYQRYCVQYLKSGIKASLCFRAVSQIFSDFTSCYRNLQLSSLFSQNINNLKIFWEFIIKIL
jgi:hypothetical protein